MTPHVAGSDHRIVLGYDASPGAERAAALLESRDWVPGTRVRVVSSPAGVGPPASAFARLTEVTARHAWVESSLSQAQGDVVESLRMRGLDVDATQVPGPAARSIMTTADAFGADLVVVGTRGHGPLRSMVAGSTSAQVADRASCSVLVVREVSSRRTLVVVDPSAEVGAEARLSVFRELLGGRMRVLGVLPDAHYPRVDASETDLLADVPTDASPSETIVAERIDDLTRHLRDAGLMAAGEMTRGDLVPTVIETATSWRADFVVLLVGDDGGAGSLLHGSSVKRVLQGVGASVLVVRDGPERPRLA